MFNGNYHKDEIWRLNMENSQDKLKAEFNRLCDEKRYYDAAKLLVNIDDEEGIIGALLTMFEEWIWKAKFVDKEEESVAYYVQGFCYENDVGFVEQSMKRAVEAYERSGALGNMHALYRIGECYSEGVPDDATAVKWYRKAADAGLVTAQCSLGCAYLYGKGVSKDMSEAVKWFRTAAENGDALAQSWFGIALIRVNDGNILGKDEALKWLNVAAAGESRYAADAKQWIERLGGNGK